MNNNHSNTLEVMQGAKCWGRTLVVLFSTMSAVSGSQGLTDFPDKGHPLYIKIMCPLHHLEQLDDVMTFHPVFTTRLDDITIHNHGNHGKLLLSRFIANPQIPTRNSKITYEIQLQYVI